MSNGEAQNLLRRIAVGLLSATQLVICAQAFGAEHNDRGASGTRCIAFALYLQSDNERDKVFREQVSRFARERRGLKLQVYYVDRDRRHRAYLEKICKYFKTKPQTPLLYGCGKIVRFSGDAATLKAELTKLIRFTVYVRSGCPRCARAKTWVFETIRRRFPGFEVQLRDIIAEAQALRDLQALVQKHRTTAASVPVFHVCDEVVVGFDAAATTGPRLEALLKRWTVDCPKPKASVKGRQSEWRPRHHLPTRALCLHETSDSLNDVHRSTLSLGHMNPVPANLFSMLLIKSLREEQSELPPELPLPDDAKLPLPESPESDGDQALETIPEEAVELPVFGRVRVDTIGLPLFTIAVGLVDGFNPCAMWVLLFLLSVLVNVHSRWKMLAVAGTFVVISGAVYFAFMAAWLNVFLLVGMLTPVRITLAMLAIAMGMIHIKDFFAFKRGITLSIPESAKPGIYQRVRRIVTAENLAGAIVGASILATLVNIVELLCTAGLPALYTQILSARQLPAWQNYMYLAIYCLAYMFDDGLMVAIAVITLGRRKLQETHGRWLKLMSGATIFALGTVMLVRPNWLGMSY